jgi:hypothetical protein
MTKKYIPITIKLSPEQIQQLDEKRKQMSPKPRSRAQAVVMLLQDQLGGQDQGFTLSIGQAGQSDAGLDKVIDFGAFSMKVPNDFEGPTC